MTRNTEQHYRVPRLAIVTTSAPPSASGQARVLEKLLTGAEQPLSSHLFLSDQLHLLDEGGSRLGHYVGLAAPRYQLFRTMPLGWLQRANNASGLVRDCFVRSREIAAAIAKHPVDVVVGCSGNPFDLPASFLAARRMSIPFVAYLFDDPVFQWEPGLYRRLSRYWESVWGPRAAAIIAPNEVLVSDVKRRVRCGGFHIVRNPAENASFAPSRVSVTWKRGPNEPRSIIYTGSVYAAQASAFKNLVAALEHLDGAFNLRIYTSQSESQVQGCGLVGPHVHRFDHLPQMEALQVQREADVLFLPLAFDSPIPEVIRSSAPAKVGEYLASGRPVLVHAPAGSFVSELFKSKAAGVVVDEPIISQLIAALHRIADHPDEMAEMTLNARAAAADFSIETARSAFWGIIGAACRN